MSSLIEPLYTTPQVNATIELDRGSAEIESGKQKFQCFCRAEIRLKPHPQLVFVADLSAQPQAAFRMWGSAGPIAIRFGNERNSHKSILLRLDGASNEAILLPATQRVVRCSDRRKRLSRVAFHVLNLQEFGTLGEESTDLKIATNEGGRRRVGRSLLTDRGWHIDLQELSSAKILHEEVRSEGGYAITHVGMITREDGGSFRTTEAEELLIDLNLFLSFSAGNWVPAMLPVGFDGKGELLYEQWNVPPSSSWVSSRSWFDRLHGDSLSKIYPGFIALLHDPQLGKPARNALYWYLRSNRAGNGAGIDGGIILSQAALETLASAYLSKMGLSKKGPAAESLRGTLDHLRLPTKVPKALHHTAAAQQQKTWRDGPHAITKIRNDLVHPKAHAPSEKEVVWEVWNLAQWYIELIILKLSDYRGVYSNRLTAKWVGEVEEFPLGDP